MNKDQARQLLGLASVYAKRPRQFIEDHIGDRIFDYQEWILGSIAKNKVTAVRSCHNSGKSFLAARAVAWWLTNRPNSIVVTTAPTFKQVENIIWREISGMWKASVKPLGGTVLKTRWDIADNWYAIGVSTNDPTNMQGSHAKSGDILVIVDEGAGVDEAMFESIDGILTSAGARLLVIGNPTSLTGYFITMFRNPRVSKKHISCFDTPNFVANGIRTIEDLKNFDWTNLVNPYPFMLDPEWAYDKLLKWGEDSPMFHSRVLGNFPDQDENTLIPINWLDLASTEERRLIIPRGAPAYGHDIARYGDDNSVIHKRYGDWHCKPIVYQKAELTDTTGRAVRALRDENGPYFMDITGGLGAGPYARMRELGWKQVHGLNMSSNAIEKEEFLNLRAEIGFIGRGKFESNSIYIPNDDDLKAELSNIKYIARSDGRRQLEPKEAIKKRMNGRSPDRADAFFMSYATPGQAEGEVSFGKHNMWSRR